MPKRKYRGATADSDEDGDGADGILSQSLRRELGSDGGEAVLPSRKRKPKGKGGGVSEEAVQEQLRLSRRKKKKLRQLEEQRERAKKRAAALARLQESKMSAEHLGLLRSSGSVGQRSTMKQRVKLAFRKQKAGLTLTEEERADLFETRGDAEEPADGGSLGAPTPRAAPPRVVSGTAVRHESSADDDSEDSEDSEDNDDNDDNEGGEGEGDEDAEEGEPTGPGRTGDAGGGHAPEAPKPETAPQDQGSRGQPGGGKADGPGPGGEAPDGEALGGETSASGVAKHGAPDGAGEGSGRRDGNKGFVLGDLMAQIASLRSASAASTGAERRSAVVRASENRKSVAAEIIDLDPKDVYHALSLDTSWVGREASAEVREAARLAAIERAKRLPETALRHERVVRPAAINEGRMLLPTVAMEAEIMDALATNDVILLCGETGSGKSTQVPQFLVEAGYTRSGRFLIGCTQPRRVAATSTAKRIGEELGDPSLVRHAVRYDVQSETDATRVKVMTDGILLAEAKTDLLLRKYSAIIIDEAHERSVNTDILLGLLSRAVPLRRSLFDGAAAQLEAMPAGSEQRRAFAARMLPPLKLVVMSATLRVGDFRDNRTLFESPPPVLRVEARQHPVTIHFSKRTELVDFEGAAYRKVLQIHRKLPPGGILLFLTGKREIDQMCKRLERGINGARRAAHRAAEVDPSAADAADSVRGGADDAELDAFDADGAVDDYDEQQALEEERPGGGSGESGGEGSDGGHAEAGGGLGPAVVLPLHAMLGQEQQARVFAAPPEGHRLIVVATNVAETSLTIPGIAYVVDPGRAKRRVYEGSSGEEGYVSRFEVGWTSKASALQRAGRAGRTGPGHCYRLYSSAVYGSQLPDAEPPEIQLRPLEDVVLSMKSIGIYDLGGFPFPTPPPPAALKDAERVLAALGAVSSAPELLLAARKVGKDLPTRLTLVGEAMAAFPIGVRSARMLIAAAALGDRLLDLAVAVVAVLSERSAILGLDAAVKQLRGGATEKGTAAAAAEEEAEEDSAGERGEDEGEERGRMRRALKQWHDGKSDVLASLKAAGAFAFATRAQGDTRRRREAKAFCEQNGLHLSTMQRGLSLRKQLVRILQRHGVCAPGAAVSHLMAPPDAEEAALLRTVICAGFVDQVAVRISAKEAMAMLPGCIDKVVARAESSAAAAAAAAGDTADGSADLPTRVMNRLKRLCRQRAVYRSVTADVDEPLFLGHASCVRDADLVVYESLLRTAGGTPKTVMQCVSAVGPEDLFTAARGSSVLCLGPPLASPAPTYSRQHGAMRCSVRPRFGVGHRSIELPATAVPFSEAHAEFRERVFFEDVDRLRGAAGGPASAILRDAEVGALRLRQEALQKKHEAAETRWFGRFFLEGKVCGTFAFMRKKGWLIEEPATMTRGAVTKRSLMLVEALGRLGELSPQALRDAWRSNGSFLRAEVRQWIAQQRRADFDRVWAKAIERELQAAP